MGGEPPVYRALAVPDVLVVHGVVAPGVLVVLVVLSIVIVVKKNVWHSVIPNVNTNTILLVVISVAQMDFLVVHMEWVINLTYHVQKKSLSEIL